MRRYGGVNAGVKTLVALFALAVVGLVLLDWLKRPIAELVELRRRVVHLQAHTDQHAQTFRDMDLRVAELERRVVEDRNQSSPVATLAASAPSAALAVPWLPAGVDKAVRRAEQHEALMALGVNSRYTQRFFANVTTSRWCEALLASLATEPHGRGVLEAGVLLPNVTRSIKADRVLRASFLGQHHQDWALVSAVFAAEAAAGRSGVYLDLAAAWPTHISNTFFFDACLGWQGVCIEADPLKHPALLAQRGCVLVDTCTAREEGTSVFINPMQHDGTSKTRHGTHAKSGTTHALNCTTLERILRETNTTHVDFLSLDAEGAELDALLGADMTAVRIEIIVLEVEHFTSPTANFTTKGADFAAWFAQHDYVPAVVFPVDRMPPPPLTAKSVLTEIPRWGSRSVVKDVLWVRRDSLYRPRVEAWADAQLSVDTQLSARPN